VASIQERRCLKHSDRSIDWRQPFEAKLLTLIGEGEPDRRLSWRMPTLFARLHEQRPAADQEKNESQSSRGPGRGGRRAGGRGPTGVGGAALRQRSEASRRAAAQLPRREADAVCEFEIARLRPSSPAEIASVEVILR
jgi:hypothetical protein